MIYRKIIFSNSNCTNNSHKYALSTETKYCVLMHFFTYHCLVGKGAFLTQQDIADAYYNYSAFDRNVVLHIIILNVDKYCEVAQ